MATPASQLGITSQPSKLCAAAAQPRKGKKKLASFTAAASFHFSLNTTGSSSAPARNVKTIAPIPERNLTHDSSVPRTADPTAAPITSCAIVPTTISDSAVEIRSQMDRRLAMSARPNQSAARAHTPVIGDILSQTYDLPKCVGFILRWLLARPHDVFGNRAGGANHKHTHH